MPYLSCGGVAKPLYQVPTFADGTDEEIATALQKHYAGEIDLADYWSVGDERQINISAIAASGTYDGVSWTVNESHRAQTITVRIIGIKHDNLTTPINGIAKAAITVDMKDCLRDASVSDTDGANNTEKGYMHYSSTNVVGWTYCARRAWCNGGFYQALPEVLRSCVKSVNKLTSEGNKSDIINTDSDKAFLLSEVEVFGTTNNSFTGEGSQYSLYAEGDSYRIKLPRNSNDVSAAWWERSPTNTYSNMYCAVTSDISLGISNANVYSGISPAFCM